MGQQVPIWSATVMGLWLACMMMFGRVGIWGWVAIVSFGLLFPDGPDYIVLSKVDYSSINVDPMRSLSFMHQKTTQKLHVNACCCGLGIYGKIYILLHSGMTSA